MIEQIFKINISTLKIIGQNNKSNKIVKTAGYLDNLSIFLKTDLTDFKNKK